jgi:pimeloyl-ACP methyl ester carboxylesterase
MCAVSVALCAIYVHYVVTGHMQLELRSELFVPPYAMDDDNAPAISAIGDISDATAVVDGSYGGELTISFTARTPDGPMINVTSVTLVAPSAGTHGYNNNQRLVWLKVLRSDLDDDSGSVTVALPPTPEVAPPQLYMLFLNNGKTYSRAWWVHLKP